MISQIVQLINIKINNKMLKLWKTPVFKETKHLSKYWKKSSIVNQVKFNFSAGGHGHGHSGSGSGSEHEHDHHEDHDHGHHSSIDIIGHDYVQETRSRIFRKSQEFSVENLLNHINHPITRVNPKLDSSQVSVFNSEEEYIKYLGQSFEKKALEKYPEYKTHLAQFKHLIPNYDKLNPYAREAYTLDTYLHWKLEVEEHQIRENFNFSGSAAERAAQRVNFFENLTMSDHHHDSSIMHHLKEQLKELLENEKEFEEFKQRYNENIESNLLKSIVEKRRQSFYYDIVENKSEINKQLFEMDSEGNKHKFVSHVTPHDHIHPQHFQSSPEKINEEKWKYLAYFDIILDQHLRQVRPSSISESEEMFKYVKDEYKPLRNIQDHEIDNMYWDYLYTLDNEFYVKFKEDVSKVLSKMDTLPDIENKVRM